MLHNSSKFQAWYKFFTTAVKVSLEFEALAKMMLSPTLIFLRFSSKRRNSIVLLPDFYKL